MLKKSAKKAILNYEAKTNLISSYLNSKYSKTNQINHRSIKLLIMSRK